MKPAALRGWPNAKHSRLLAGPVHRWHVQEAGDGPAVLLLHGAGGSTHSYRDILPDLARDVRVVAVDLPGHGFTQLGARQRSGLLPMAEDLAALCAQEGVTPALIVGHSAGGAVALRLADLMVRAGLPGPGIVGINPALSAFKGLAGVLFPVFAKVLAAIPFAPGLFAARSASEGQVHRLIASTGSRIDPAGLALYRRLIEDRDHVDGALQMMAQWDLGPLLNDLPGLAFKTLFIAGQKDRTVPPRTAHEAARLMPDATVEDWPDLGHLLHEERPAEVAERLRALLRDVSPAAP